MHGRLCTSEVPALVFLNIIYPTRPHRFRADHIIPRSIGLLL